MSNLSEIAQMSRASQDKFELERLLVLLDEIKPRRIVEIGVHRGGFVETMRQAFPDAIVVGVDIDFSKLEFTDFYALSGDSHLPSMREAVNDILKGQPIDFLFIDGDHTAPGVLADFEIYSPLVRSGGLIAFHDIMRRPGQIPGCDVAQIFDAMSRNLPSVKIWNSPLQDLAPGIGVLFL